MTLFEDLLYIIFGSSLSKNSKMDFLYLSHISEPIYQALDDGGTGKENPC